MAHLNLDFGNAKFEQRSAKGSRTKTWPNAGNTKTASHRLGDHKIDQI